jgi:putative FmdB family regulatory protein
MRYDYRCPDCLDVTVHEHKMDDEPNILCPECGDSLVKYFGDPDVNIVYKGFGWVGVDSRIIHRASDVHGDLGI